MSITKNKIVKNITRNSLISSIDASSILESLLSIIKSKSKSKSIKLAGFGTFSFKKTSKRVGRNPKTQDSYIIPSINKINFRPSKKIKDKINWWKKYSF